MKLQIRLYDIETLKAFVSADVNKHHFGPINSVRFSNEAQVQTRFVSYANMIVQVYASGSKDGSLKLWDTISNHVAVV